MQRDRFTAQRGELPCDVRAELHRLRCQMRVSEFKEELRRDAATVRRALDQALREIERRERA